MAYERDGFLLLDDFVPLERSDALTARAREIVAVLAGDSAGPVFSAELEHGTEDEYFLNPKGRVRFDPPGPTVFPEAAFQPLPARRGSVVLHCMARCRIAPAPTARRTRAMLTHAPHRRHLLLPLR